MASQPVNPILTETGYSLTCQSSRPRAELSALVAAELGFGDLADVHFRDHGGVPVDRGFGFFVHLVNEHGQPLVASAVEVHRGNGPGPFLGYELLSDSGISAAVPSQRYKLTISYRGTRYHGWQWQGVNPVTWKGEMPAEGEGIPTIQEEISRVLRGVVGHPVAIVGSSRTDAGVHAKGQVAHFDTDQTQIPPEGLRRAVNARLPDDILISAIEPAPETFDAISSTVSKRYQYFIWNAPDRPVFFADLAWHRWQELNAGEMALAARQLVGEHDFASFARPGHGRENTVRRLLSCDVSRRGPRLVIAVEGTGFLWNMVRIIVGTLVEVGLGRFSAGDVAAMLGAKDRRAAGGTAPAHGLYLQWIRFVD